MIGRELERRAEGGKGEEEQRRKGASQSVSSSVTSGNRLMGGFCSVQLKHLFCLLVCVWPSACLSHLPAYRLKLVIVIVLAIAIAVLVMLGLGLDPPCRLSTWRPTR